MYENQYQGEPRQQLELVHPVGKITDYLNLVQPVRYLAWSAVAFLSKCNVADTFVVWISLQTTRKCNFCRKKNFDRNFNLTRGRQAKLSIE
jgi:hypothetical protein